jgi:hypothetical protein
VLNQRLDDVAVPSRHRRYQRPRSVTTQLRGVP